jgi:hypothetical protein
MPFTPATRSRASPAIGSARVPAPSVFPEQATKIPHRSTIVATASFGEP